MYETFTFYVIMAFVIFISLLLAYTFILPKILKVVLFFLKAIESVLNKRASKRLSR